MFSQEIEFRDGFLNLHVRRRPHGGVKRAGPLGRQGDQIVVVKAEDRRFQRRGQGKIVLRQQARAANRDEVHHRDMLRQFKPVGARHRDAFFLERADHRLEKGVAAAHQNHDVAGPDRPAFALRLDRLAGAGFKPARNGLGNAPRGGDRRIGRVLVIERQFPVALFLGYARRDHVPDFHAGRQVAFPRLMNRADVIGLRREAAKIVGQRKNLVHRVENALRGAEGQSSDRPG